MDGATSGPTDEIGGLSSVVPDAPAGMAARGGLECWRGRSRTSLAGGEVGGGCGACRRDVRDYRVVLQIASGIAGSNCVWRCGIDSAHPARHACSIQGIGARRGSNCTRCHMRRAHDYRRRNVGRVAHNSNTVDRRVDCPVYSAVHTDSSRRLFHHLWDQRRPGEYRRSPTAPRRRSSGLREVRVQPDEK